MSQPQIIDKLNRFLRNYPVFKEECQVIYLLVEIRKILDQDNNRNYPLLRFYCDWSVHTAKDRITPEMKVIMERVYAEILHSMNFHTHQGDEVMKFMYMENLQSEMQGFLGAYGLPGELPGDKECWLNFIGLLVQILTDQPINNPCKEITRFQFLPVRYGSVRGVIYFANKIGQYDHFEYLDTY